MRRYPPPNASQPSDLVLDKGDLAFLLEKNEDKAINTRNSFLSPDRFVPYRRLLGPSPITRCQGQ